MYSSMPLVTNFYHDDALQSGVAVVHQPDLDLGVLLQEVEDHEDGLVVSLGSSSALVFHESIT